MAVRSFFRSICHIFVVYVKSHSFSLTKMTIVIIWQFFLVSELNCCERRFILVLQYFHFHMSALRIKWETCITTDSHTLLINCVGNSLSFKMSYNIWKLTQCNWSYNQLFRVMCFLLKLISIQMWGKGLKLRQRSLLPARCLWGISGWCLFQQPCCNESSSKQPAFWGHLEWAQRASQGTTGQPIQSTAVSPSRSRLFWSSQCRVFVLLYSSTFAIPADAQFLYNQSHRPRDWDSMYWCIEIEFSVLVI